MRAAVAAAAIAALSALAVPFSAAAQSGPAPSALDQARSLEKAGKASAAFDAYESWLTANKDSAAYLETLLHAAQIAPTIGQGIELLKTGVQALHNAADRSAVYVAIGTAAELAGDLDSAQQYYEMSYLESSGAKDYHSLLRSAQLLFELGKPKEAAGRAQIIVNALGSAKSAPARSLVIAAQLLNARVDAEENGPESGYRRAAPLLDDPASGPEVLLFIAESANAAGDFEAAGKARDALKSRYPNSPEYALCTELLGDAAGASLPPVTYLPSPSRMLAPLEADPGAVSGPQTAVTQAPSPPGEQNGASPPPAADTASVTAPASVPTASSTTAGSDSAETAASLSHAIQAGSFREQANAESLVQELSAKGYRPEIHSATVGNDHYYQVLLPVKVSGAETLQEAEQKLLLQLRGDGYEGFIVSN